MGRICVIFSELAAGDRSWYGSGHERQEELARTESKWSPCHLYCCEVVLLLSGESCGTIWASNLPKSPASIADAHKDGGWMHWLKNKTRPLARTGLMKGGVVPLGVEPRTHGFSVHCSTTWAKVPLCCLFFCKGSILFYFHQGHQRKTFSFNIT